MILLRPATAGLRVLKGPLYFCPDDVYPETGNVNAHRGTLKGYFLDVHVQYTTVSVHYTTVSKHYMNVSKRYTGVNVQSKTFNPGCSRAKSTHPDFYNPADPEMDWIALIIGDWMEDGHSIVHGKSMSFS